MTAVPESVRSAYDRVLPVVEDVARYVNGTLGRYCSDRGYIFLDRTKTLESLAEKLEGGRLQAWSEVDDLYACTIVIPVASDEAVVLRKLDTSFQRTIVKSRSQAKKAPDVFRFDGCRWYGVIRPDAAERRQAGVGQQLFEVQVVTAFEYAWTTVTHELIYKSDNVQWQRQRLAAHLKAAVEQIEMLIAAFDSASDAIPQSPWPENEAKAQIILRCRQLLDEHLIPDVLCPRSWRRFADNFYSLVTSYQRDPAKIHDAVAELLGVMETDLRGADPIELPVSGSLFQYVISVVGRPDTAGTLNKFRVVPSRELGDVYGLSTPSDREFRFDGSSEIVVSPAQPLPDFESLAKTNGPPADLL